MNKFLSWFLAAVLMLSLLPVVGMPVAAEDFQDPGWILDSHWSFDEESATLRENSDGGAFNVWKQTVSGSYELSFVAHFDDRANVRTATGGYLRQFSSSSVWQFLNWELTRNAEHNAVYGGIRFSSDGGSTWSAGLQTTDWTSTTLSAIRISFVYIDGADTMLWSFSDPTTGEVLQSQTLSTEAFSESFLKGTKELLLLASGSGMASFNELKLGVPALTPASFGWSYVDGEEHAPYWTAASQTDFSVSGDGSMSRICKAAITNPGGFSFSVKAETKNSVRNVVGLMGLEFALVYSGNDNQVYVQYWDGKDWSINEWVNANGKTAVLTFTRTAADGDMTLTVAGEGQTAASFTIPAQKLTAAPEIYLCTDGGGSSRFSGIAIDNNYSKPSTDSEAWILGENWVSNQNDTELTLLTPCNSECEWRTVIDGSKGWEVHYDLDFTGTIDTNDSWGNETTARLRSSADNSVAYMRIKRYRNGGGRYQAYCELEFQGAKFSLNDWGTKDSGVLSGITSTLKWEEGSNVVQWIICDKQTGSALITNNLPADKFSKSFLTSADLRLHVGSENYSGTAGTIKISNPGWSVPIVSVAQLRFSLGADWMAGADADGLVLYHTADTETSAVYNANMTDGAFDISYSFTADTFTKSNLCVGNFSLRDNASNPERWLFVRVQMTANHQVMLQCQAMGDNKWTDLFQTDWIADTPDTVRLRFAHEQGSDLCRFTLYAADDKVLLSKDITTAVLTDANFYSKSLKIVLGGENGFGGTYHASDFTGFPEIRETDRRATAFGKVLYVGSETMNYTAELTALIGKYQNSNPTVAQLAEDATAAAITAENADLIVTCIGSDALRAGKSAADYRTELTALLTEVKNSLPQTSVLAVACLPFAGGFDAYADYVAAAYQTAKALDLVFIDTCSAVAGTSWSVQTDGVTPNGTGKLLLANAAIAELARNCTCLATNRTTELDLICQPTGTPNEATLTAFTQAASEQDMEKVLKSGHTDFLLGLYRMMNTKQQQELHTALLAQERCSLGNWEQADALFLNTLLRVWGTPASVQTAKLTRYVATGDSISYGATAANRDDAWVFTLHKLIEAAQGTDVVLINEAISGTRMSSRTDNDMFPPAKETVQEYVVDNNPDFLTVAYGINDINTGTTLETFLTDYRSYLSAIRTACPDTLIMLVGIIPMGSDDRGETIRLWNAAIKALAEEFGILYAEPYDDILGTEWLLSDNLHPNDVGYCVMANAMFRTLNAQFNLSGSYKITWDINGNKTVTEANAGTIPSFAGSTDKPADDSYSYSFTGWLPEIVPVNGDITYTAQYELTPLTCEHDWVLDEDKSFAANCTEDGKKVYTCSKCNESKEEPVEALGHDMITDAAAPATCTETGLTEGSHCSRCDYEIAQSVINALGHDYAVTEDYFYTYYDCSRCDESRAEEKQPFAYESSPSAAYSDIVDGWYRHAADYVLTAELMGSTSTTEKTFEPNTNTSRAMLVAVLFRMEGSQKVENPTVGFADVKNEWFADAVIWAAENGIVSGTGNGRFSPNALITREQIATILYNYCKNYKKLDVSKTDGLKGFEDADSVSSWAIEAVRWAVAEKLISGRMTGGKTLLVPQGNAMRCEVAFVLMSFAKNIMLPAAYTEKTDG